VGPRGSHVVLLAVALLATQVVAVQAGPCTAQIDRLERQIRSMPAGSATGPTGQQTVGAQLHHQPTPGSVQGAEARAQADAMAAIQRARNADAAGDAGACAKALRDAKDVYGLD
jgi:hypothetical protein